MTLFTVAVEHEYDPADDAVRHAAAALDLTCVELGAEVLSACDDPLDAEDSGLLDLPDGTDTEDDLGDDSGSG